MKIKVYGKRIEYSKNRTSYIPVFKEVEITKIKNTATRKGQCGYYGYCPNYAEEFPEDNPEDKFFNKKGWCHFVKSQNKGVKIPIVPMGEEIELIKEPSE